MAGTSVESTGLDRVVLRGHVSFDNFIGQAVLWGGNNVPKLWTYVVSKPASNVCVG